MYERHERHLLAWPKFLVRAGRHLAWALLIILGAVSIGTVGYHTLGRLQWIDAFLNASMILSGMGPVDRMDSATAKVFSALYALSVVWYSSEWSGSSWLPGSIGSTIGFTWRNRRPEPTALGRRFRASKKAWAFSPAQPPGYRPLMICRR
jgi:hypothetical protein